MYRSIKIVQLLYSLENEQYSIYKTEYIFMTAAL